MCQNKEICDRVSGKIIEIDDSPYSIFYKRIVPREMPYAMEKWRKSPFKTDRDKKANENEASFLSFLGEMTRRHHLAEFPSGDQFVFKQLKKTIERPFQNKWMTKKNYFQI